MVGEFPELQGVMGGYYARHDGEDDRVAQAIADQYRVRRDETEDACSLISEVLQIADRIAAVNEHGLIRAEERLTASAQELRRSLLLTFGVTLSGGLLLAVLTIGLTLRLERLLEPFSDSLEEIIEVFQPTVLIGTTGQPGDFTPEAIRARQRWVRDTFWKLVGGMPERTPLNARVTGAFDRPGYRLEKVVYESQPGFHVSANLYIPTSGKPPFPGVLFQMGHTTNGKAGDLYQRCCQGLVKLGYQAARALAMPVFKQVDPAEIVRELEAEL